MIEHGDADPGLLAEMDALIVRAKLKIAELENIRAVLAEHEDKLGLVYIRHLPVDLGGSGRLVLALLLKRSTGVTREAIYDALYGHKPECNQPDSRVIDQYLHKLRRELKRGFGVTLNSTRQSADGRALYWLTPEDKARIIPDLIRLNTTIQDPRLEVDLRTLVKGSVSEDGKTV